MQGYSRKGAALHGLGDLPAAADAYKQGLTVDPNNAALKKSLEEVESAMATGVGSKYLSTIIPSTCTTASYGSDRPVWQHLWTRGVNQDCAEPKSITSSLSTGCLDEDTRNTKKPSEPQHVSPDIKAPFTRRLTSLLG